ncbi:MULTISPECIES: MbcA/ParS/Xre antitoxin family protein [unclassified Pseudomonas]|uniref:MbcA/ParS/Xre antitoxin family protein n=1 Tax=unclassified Pseudomonas TaxID=196821 RepID=UPI0030DCB012
MPTSSPVLTPREQLDVPKAGRVALKFFFNLMERWGCNAEQQRTLLGGVGNTTFYKYKHLPPNIRLPHDTLERISYLMGIHKALSIIFSNSRERAYTWVSSPNAAAPFNGRTALDYMLAGRVVDIADVRRYLDGVRG